MIFFSKRPTESTQSSSTEACVSILGLFLAVGLVGGLGALIYGLIKGNLDGTIGGGAVLGVSFVGTIILVLVFVCCLKKNNINSNANQQRSSLHQPHHQQNRHMKRQQMPSHDIAHISGAHNYDHHHNHQQKPNRYDMQMLPAPVHSSGLTDSTNYSYGKQISQSSSKISGSAYLNQSNGSINNQNYRLPVNSNPKRNSYNQH